MAAKEKRGQKFGRNLRRPSSALQKMRTEKNKRVHREREQKRQAVPKEMRTARGSARHARRKKLQPAVVLAA